jgi:hypothetical protein
MCSLGNAPFSFFPCSSIVGRDEPEVKVAPIITDGSHVRSLHWTGHYIDDPTLAFTNGETHPFSSIDGLLMIDQKHRHHVQSERGRWEGSNPWDSPRRGAVRRVFRADSRCGPNTPVRHAVSLAGSSALLVKKVRPHPRHARQRKTIVLLVRLAFSNDFTIRSAARNRLWLVWLNNASLEFGGRLVSPWPIELRTLFSLLVTPSRRRPT